MFRNQVEHVVVSGLGKRYGTATVLNSVDLTIRRGEIHALVGENGAGKSTLSKIIAGVVRRDAGHVIIDGRPVSYRDPAEALRDGVTLIAQEVALAPALSVVANVFLGNESSSGGVLRSRNLHQRYMALNAQLNFNIPARVEVRALPFGDQQKVEIMRALARESKLIILDEPTASLGQEDKEVLFRALRDLRERGKTIVYISHHLDEVLALADSVTIMRDGRVIRSGAAAEESEQTLIQGMLGRSLESIFPDKRPPAPDSSLILETRALSSRGRFADVDLQVRAGEIVGLAGLVGAGRSEVARAIFGADTFDSGRVLLHGREVRFRSPRAASRRGIGMVPESRRDQGLVLPLSTNENLTIVALPDYSTLGVIRAGRLRAAARAMISRLDIRTKNPRGATAQLSGGNQQKVLFGKWLMAQPQLLIVDEPTRGVDVGAKQGIYDLIAELAASGVAILLISSELEEVIGLSHRVIVMREGRVSASLGPGEVSETAIMSAAFLPHPSSTPGGSS